MSNMSATQFAVTQPGLLVNVDSLVPSYFGLYLNILRTDLPPEWVDQFINLFTDIFNYLPTTLPEVFTTLSSQSSLLSPHFLTKFLRFTHRLNTAHSYLLTTLHFNLPSPNLSPLCSGILDYLHLKLYTNMDRDIPTLLTSLRISSQHLPLTLTSSELDNMLMLHVEDLLSNIWLMENTLFEMLARQPYISYSDPYWCDFVDFFETFDIYIWMERLHYRLEDNPDAEDYVMDELSVVYVQQERTDAETDPDNCTICLEVMQDGDYARRLRCLHAFHVDCIDRWLEMNNVCPMCRTHINATHEI